MKPALIIMFVPGMLLSTFTMSLAQRSNDPPGSIKLVVGYTHQRMQGIDTRVGKITKRNGLEISYDIGRLAGD